MESPKLFSVSSSDESEIHGIVGMLFNIKGGSTEIDENVGFPGNKKS
jgi:hypothetical protein